MPTNSHELLFLSQSNIDAVGLSMPEIIGAVEEAFKQKRRGEAEMPAWENG